LAEAAGRVLVTGAGGFIGRYAVPQLQARGFEVHAIGRNALDDPSVVSHLADLLDRNDTQRAIRDAKATHLLHLAWYSEPGKFWDSPLNLDWAAASLGLLRNFVEHGGRRAVFAGTCAEYAEGDRPEGYGALPPTLYGATRDALRRTSEAYSRTADLSFGWGRLFFAYGPHEAAGRLIPDAIRSLLKREPFATTTGHQLRDFMHVEDVAGALVAFLASDVCSTIDIGTGDAVPVRVVLETIAGEIGNYQLIEFGARPLQDGEPAVLRANPAPLKQDVGFNARYSLADGLSDTVKWWRAHLSQQVH
jgi:nucleoside-diphosphate-sugar epimerase